MLERGLGPLRGSGGYERIGEEPGKPRPELLRRLPDPDLQAPRAHVEQAVHKLGERLLGSGPAAAGIRIGLFGAGRPGTAGGISRGSGPGTRLPLPAAGARGRRCGARRRRSPARHRIQAPANRGLHRHLPFAARGLDPGRGGTRPGVALPPKSLVRGKRRKRFVDPEGGGGARTHPRILAPAEPSAPTLGHGRLTSLPTGCGELT